MDYIFDIDDTLSNTSHRNYLFDPKNNSLHEYYSLLIDDEPIVPVIYILKALHSSGHRIVLCTGRPEYYRSLTVQWLKKYDVPYHGLYMRQQSEAGLRNAQTKKVLINRIKNSGYEPVAVFEDNPLSVAMWKEKGLTVLQIA